MVKSGLKKLPIGVSDFDCIRRYDSYYADKTQLIAKLLDNVHPNGTILFTRPRRFGKSLALDMLRCFFDCNAKEQNRPLFDGLAIASSEYMEEFGKYPVINLTFKDVCFDSLRDTKDALREILLNALAPFAYLQRSKKIELSERKRIKQLFDGKATLARLSISLAPMCAWLAQHHGQPAIVLIDEYDRPMQTAYQYGFYEPIRNVMRNLFSSALKDNPHLRLAVVTGVLRIAKDSLFSGLNNLTVDTILQDKYSDCFGFTQDEVTALAASYGQSDKFAEIKEWYDGYRFGKRDIYNPWSVLRYFSEDCQPAPYWMDTSSNDLIVEFLRILKEKQRTQIMELYRGGTVEASVDTAVSYPQLQHSRELLQKDDEQVQLDCADTVFSLMAVTGYLKPVDAVGGNRYNLQVPNAEVNTIFAQEILRYLQSGNRVTSLHQLWDALRRGDNTAFAAKLQEVLWQSASYFDGTEAFYHGFMTCLLLGLDENYKVLSNREAGLGRADILLQPRFDKSLPGFVFEFKESKKADGLEQLAEAALQQIAERRYAAAFPPEIKEVRCYGLAFCGKACSIRELAIRN